MLLSHNIMREIKKSQRNNSNLTYLIIKGMLTNEYRITQKKLHYREMDPRQS